jgi:4'-phosphopantetheinyl transferase EntD
VRDDARAFSRSLIEEILPASVASADAFEDAADARLFPEEEAVVARAVGSRRRQFATARACAHRALAELGVAAVPILPGEGGAPCWPPGVVGSITHTEGYRASAVAHANEVITLGIDAEPNARLPRGILGRIALEAERRQVREFTATDPSVCWDRLLFSAKESVYKAWFPLTRRRLGFEDAAVDLDRGRGGFAARLLVAGPEVEAETLWGFAGRWLATERLVITAIAVPSRGTHMPSVEPRL